MIRLLLSLVLIALPACAPTQASPTAPTATDVEPEAIFETVEPEAISETGEPAPLLDDDLPEVDEVTADAAEAPPPAPVQPARHPLADVSDQALEAMLLDDPASLGPASLGRPGGGALLNAVQMPSGPMWRVVNPSQTWGTQETIDALIRCIEQVNREHPNTRPLRVGDISEQGGGRIAPHSSHQSGRDVDVAYYYSNGKTWYARGNARNLDLARTWTFVRAMITETDVQAIFIDRKIQRILKEHALSIGEDEAWLNDVFGGGGSRRRALITHQPGHDTHIHVRFYNPIAQETGRRVYPLMLAHNMISPPTSFVRYRAKRGDNLGRIARKYRTTVKAIKRANRLRSSRIYAGRVYRIPRRGGVTKVRALVLPARRLPPPPQGTDASADGDR